jgi:hypothetical protein
VHHLASGLDVLHGYLDLFQLAPDPLDRGLHCAQLLDLGLDFPGPDIGVGQPGLGLAVAFAEPGHLLIGYPHLLHSVGQELASALQGAQLLDRLLDARADLIQPPHPGSQVGGGAVQASHVLAE